MSENRIADVIDECHRIAQEKGFWELDGHRVNKPHWASIMCLMSNIGATLDSMRKDGLNSETEGRLLSAEFLRAISDLPHIFCPTDSPETSCAHVCKQLAHIIIEVGEAFDEITPSHNIQSETFFKELIDVGIVLFDLLGYLMGGEKAAQLFDEKMHTNRNRPRRYGTA